MRLLLALALVVLAGHALAQSPERAKRLALVIGNGAYRDAPLPNPVNDAHDMTKALEASGFTVIRRENASLREMHLALREFGDRLDRQGTGVFYFAGHGMQVRGRNYLIPVDADIAREDEVAFAALDLAAVMEKLDSAKNPVNLVILDACRNNPFGGRFAVSARGLAPIDAPPGTLIAFATAPGSTAADGRGRNGLYTQHLVKALERPGLPIEEVFKAVRAGVRAESKNQQVPWESTSLESAVVLRAAPPRPVVAAAPASSKAAATRAAPYTGAPPAFAPGDRWTYRVVNLADQSEREYTLKIREVRDGEVHYTNGAVGDLAGNFSKNIRQGGKADLYTPSNHFYLFPLKGGASWNLEAVQDYEGRMYDLQVRLTVGAEEEVQTPAGPMRAFPITRESRWKQRNSPNHGVSTWKYWYNAGVKRYVLAEARNVTASGKVIQDERHELASFEVK